ncbi:hypothetical protein KC19_VG209400 [Ceratodon purpureus]|uniref:Pentatricopeptide repeat-containing protein n=1 Tax=Ceratodon purpureus TaxID=3225 RepID=A0A8T0HTD1_CERPU|nr:hypothetical protein KC19_VG209400 [Ceratodon purpureus]
MAMAALSCIRSPLGSDRTTGLNEKSSRSSDRNEEKGGRRLEIVAFSERNPKPCVTPLRSWGSRSAFAIVQAALKPEETGSEPSRVSSRVSYKSPRRVAIRRGKGWVNMPEPGSEQAPPVLSPGATDLMRTLMTQRSPQDVWNALDALPRGIDTWEDVMETVAELRRKRNWQSVILVFEWILQGSMFKPDVGCFNMLMDAYGKNKQWTEAEKTFYLMKKFQCVPTVTSFNVLMAAYSRGGRLDKAEDLFHEMKDTNYTPGLVTYNTYLEVLGKSGSWQQAEDVFQDMQKRGVLPAVNTFTIMINIYGKVSHIPITHYLLHVELNFIRIRLVILGREKILARNGHYRNLARLILDIMLQLVPTYPCLNVRQPGLLSRQGRTSFPKYAEGIVSS